jgi:hypothetical protein
MRIPRSDVLRWRGYPTRPVFRAKPRARLEMKTTGSRSSDHTSTSSASQRDDVFSFLALSNSCPGFKFPVEVHVALPVPTEYPVTSSGVCSWSVPQRAQCVHFSSPTTSPGSLKPGSRGISQAKAIIPFVARQLLATRNPQLPRLGRNMLSIRTGWKSTEVIARGSRAINSNRS